MTTAPTELAYGYVDGRLILIVGDTDDAGRTPDPTPATGTVVQITPKQPLIRIAGADPTTVVKQSIACTLDADGRLLDPAGNRGVWLVTGVYTVTYKSTTAAIPTHDIEVTAAHTEGSPLDLTLAMPPGGPILTPSQYAELSARIDALGTGGGPGGEGPAGPPGADGADGASAYEVAVAGGFVGTEEQWLASLVGPAGPQGDPGEPGPAGPQGEIGPTGPSGADGADGADGAKGDPGDPGPKGDKGDPGDPGATGPKGDTGDTGPQGPAGPKGDKGDQGDPGVGIPQTLSLTGSDLTLSDGGGTVTLPAGGGGSAHVYPQVSPPVARIFFPPFASVGTVGVNQNVYLTRLALPYGSITEIGVEVTTAAAAGVLRLGLYAPDAHGSHPSTRLVDAGTVDVSTTGWKTIVLSTPIAWTGGPIYGAVYRPSTSTTPQVRSAVGGSQPSPVLLPGSFSNTPAPGNVSNGGFYMAGNHDSGLPATLTLANQSFQPMFFGIRVV